jgi:tripeptidyl-peptidase I
LHPGGAGYSNIFPTPDYQKSFTASYQSKLSTAEVAMFNRSGRSYPDISTLGLGMPYIWKGQTYYGRGTSLSVPVMASIIAKVNAARRDVGKLSVGFVQPTLYANAHNTNAFHDVTKGAATGCSNLPSAQLPAAVGFDSASGLGSPRFSGFRQIFGA